MKIMLGAFSLARRNTSRTMRGPCKHTQDTQTLVVDAYRWHGETCADITSKACATCAPATDWLLCDEQQEAADEKHEPPEQLPPLRSVLTSPRYFCTNSLPTTRMNAAVVWCATALASMVLPARASAAAQSQHVSSAEHPSAATAHTTFKTPPAQPMDMLAFESSNGHTRLQIDSMSCRSAASAPSGPVASWTPPQQSLSPLCSCLAPHE
jgi:hypothetical protein